MADGEELLIVSGNERDRTGLTELFRKNGFIVTGLSDTRTARERLLEKFFPVMLLDFDVKPDGGMSLLKFSLERSPQTAVVMLTSRRSFEQAVEAFRLGAHDVISKEPSEIARIAKRVEQALPPAGEVRLLQLTDLQFSRMQIFIGKRVAPTEKPPEQLSFF